MRIAHRSDRTQSCVVMLIMLTTAMVALLLVPAAPAQAANQTYRIDSAADDRTFVFWGPFTPGPEWGGTTNWVGEVPGTNKDYRAKLLFEDINLPKGATVHKAYLAVVAADTVQIDCPTFCMFLWHQDTDLDVHWLGYGSEVVNAHLPRWKAGEVYRIDVTSLVQDIHAIGLDPAETAYTIDFTMYNPYEPVLAFWAYEERPELAAELTIYWS